MKRFLLWFLVFIFQLGFSQVPDWQNPNYRYKKLITSDSVVLDSLFILNEEFKISDRFGNEISPQNYRIDFQNSVLYLNQKTTDSIQIEYYVHPSLRRTTVYPRNPNLIVPSNSEFEALVLDNSTQEEKDIFEGLNTQGSMVRGITFGNNQGSSVQSSLDLRMNGQLSEDVGITAVIADTNVPIEADGYTQNLEQFDRVFVELFTDNSSARAGHVDLEQTQEYFGRFNRRVTGMHLKHRIHGDSSVTHFQAAGSVSRGEFKQMKFTGQEGNQGPYRLTGNHGEAYVIILSGSERIYKDGVLLQRGENYDYVMNYNTGEIVFTNKHLIRSTDRFVAEYQYTNRYYNRFLLYGGANHVGKRFNISSHIYSESDNKNNAINQSLNPMDQQILANAGNDQSQMYAPTAQQVPYEEGKVLYRRTVVDGREIYEYSNDPQDVLYEVSFSQLGENQGNYILSTNGVNGRIFEFVEPANGVPQGEYEPIRLLVAPTKKQVWSMASSYKLKNNGTLFLDAGLSNLDQNLFSDEDDEENLGLALKIGGEKQFKTGKIFLQPNFSYEFIQHNFSPLERLRSPEFVREFNLNQEIGIADQQFLQTNLQAFISDSIRLNYGFDYLDQSQNYNGNRHRFSADYLTQKTQISAQYKKMSSSTYQEKTAFDSYLLSANRLLGKLQVGAGILGESNVRKLSNNQDTLSFRWNEIYTTAMLGDTVGRFASLRLYTRKDDSTQLGVLQRYSTAFGAEFNAQLIKSENHGLNFLTHHRTVDYADSLQQVSFLNATIEWRKSLWSKAVDLGMKYEIAGGTELQRAFTYVEVADGLGIYKWLDYNNDGVQQLDEFEIAEYSDQANYIRVYTNTVNQLSTNRNGLNLSLRFNPARYFGNDTFWHRINSNIIYSTTGNYLKNDEIAAWNPWQETTYMRSKTSQFYFQSKYNAAQQYKWNLTHEFSLQENTRFVFTGLESLNTKFNKVTSQYQWNEWLTAELSNTFEWVESDSEAFVSRRFQIEGVDLVPKMYFTWSENLKSSLAYTIQDFQNTVGVGKLTAHQFNFDFTWTDGNKTSLLAKLDWVKNNFEGNPDSVVGNRMMEGLREGSNFVWQFLVQRNINNYLELNVQYSGRKNEAFSAIHTGNVQVRLNF